MPPQTPVIKISKLPSNVSITEESRAREEAQLNIMLLKLQTQAGMIVKISKTHLTTLRKLRIQNGEVPHAR